MKKIIITLLALSLTMTACSKKEDKKESKGPSTVTTGDFKEKTKPEKPKEETKPKENEKETEPIKESKDESFKDSEGKEFTKIPTKEMNKEDIDEDFINRWFFEEVIKSDAPYLNILYKGEKDKGVYATKEGVYVNVNFKTLENGALMPLNFSNDDLEVYAFTGADRLEQTKWPKKKNR